VLRGCRLCHKQLKLFWKRSGLEVDGLGQRFPRIELAEVKRLSKVLMVLSLLWERICGLLGDI